jgi:hypothetical protein
MVRTVAGQFLRSETYDPKKSRPKWQREKTHESIHRDHCAKDLRRWQGAAASVNPIAVKPRDLFRHGVLV